MSAVQLIPVDHQNWRAFAHISRETLWYPAWPGEEALAREFRRLPDEVQRSTYLILRDGQAIGRVVSPRVDDDLVIRDLGVIAEPGLAEQALDALMRNAERSRARGVRVMVFEPLWPAFARLGFVEHKRRTTMRREAGGEHLGRACSGDVRSVAVADVGSIGELLWAAYSGTIDDDGDGPAYWAGHARDVVDGLYGPFLPEASFLTPSTPPFHSATLLIEYAPACAMLAQVTTRKSHSNRGYARRLISCSLGTLPGRGYRACFLEVTLGNANAIHLYRSLGFVADGPHIVYGSKTLRAV